MSHPVFLTSSPLGHMPIGSHNQWSDFYHTASFELQADGFVPILWFMLFKTNNLHWAKYTDLLDAGDPQLHDLVAEYQHDFGDSLYAYLITTPDQALINLEENKAFFLDSVGEAHLHHFERSQELIKTHYQNFILLRSSGLATDFDSDEHLRFPLEQLEQFRQHPHHDNGLKEYQKVALSQFDDYAYFFYGVDPTSMTQNTAHDSDIQSELHPSAPTQAPSASGSGMAVWICTAIVSILTLVVWFNTHSVLYAFVVFIVSAFILGFISSIIGKTKQTDASDQHNASESKL